MQFKQAIKQAKNGVSTFSLINIRQNKDTWVDLLDNYALTIDMKLEFLQKIVEAD